MDIETEIYGSTGVHQNTWNEVKIGENASRAISMACQKVNATTFPPIAIFGERTDGGAKLCISRGEKSFECEISDGILYDLRLLPEFIETRVMPHL